MAPLGRSARVGGERVLAAAAARDEGEPQVRGTRDALWLGERRIAWQDVYAADWDADAEALQVAEVGDFGQSRPVHRVQLDDAERLLELVRERVTASLVLQRRVAVPGGSVDVIARRPPSGHGPVRWYVDYDDRVDPQRPDVRRAVEEALARCREEIGEPPG